MHTLHIQYINRSLLIAIFALVFPLAAEQSMKLSLNAAQKWALKENQMLKAVHEGVQSARAAKLQSWAGHLPEISLSEQVVRSNDAVSAFGIRLRQERFSQADFALEALNSPSAISDFRTSLEVRQPVFNGGQAIYGRWQAIAGVRAAEFELMRHRQAIHLQTAEAYWGLVLAREIAQAVRQSLETAQAHMAAARVHYQEQTAPLTDLLAAQVRVAELRGKEIAAANSVADAVDGLSLVMGVESGFEIVPTDSLSLYKVETPLSQLIEISLQARHDLSAMQHGTKAAEHNINIAQAAYLPHFNAFARIDLDAGDPFERQGESWTVGALVTWNLFSGFHSIGAVRQARAQAAQIEAQTVFLQAQIEREVRRAFRGVEAAQAQIEVGEEAVRQAKERLRISELQYGEGLITAADLLGAEVDLTHARIRQLQALYALSVGVGRLEFAVGKSLEGENKQEEMEGSKHEDE